MTQSYWQRDGGWRDRGDDRWAGTPIPGTVDFAVVGGGLAGLATAIRLRERHPRADIVVLEAERVGYGASGRNAGFLSPVAAPVWLLGADRDPAQAWAAARLHAQVHALGPWITAYAPEAELAASTLRLQADGRITAAGLHPFSRALDAIGIAHQVAPSRAHRGLPCLTMDARTVHPYRLVRGLADHAAREGITIRERARVRRLEPAAPGARLELELEREGATLRARTVIVCTNGYTSSVELGERIRAVVVHSFMLASGPLEASRLAELVRDNDFTVELNHAQAFHRRHRDRLLFGGLDKLTAPRGGAFVVPPRVAARLTTALRHSFPTLGDLATSEAWGGKFHATTTGLPIIRRVTANPSVVLNVGYGGTGVALTLVCAPLVAALASDEPLTADDARLLATIQGTRLSVRDALRAIGRVARRLARPW